MGPVATSGPARLFESGEVAREEPVVTLEDVVVAAWDDLAAEGRAECPVCAGELRAAGGCSSCGSDLG
jgi:tRNA(Ile2) C34 agmatinyltransferase TiaS